MKHLLIATTVGAVTCGACLVKGQDDSKALKPHFVSYEALLDATVMSPQDRDRTGDIDDLVIDVRNGKAVYAVIDTNELLGSQNKVVAVPYGALSWKPNRRQFTIDVTAEELKNLPEWNPNDRSHLRDSSWYSTLRGIFGDRSEIADMEQMNGDEYSWYFANAKQHSLSGDVVAINRQAKTAQGAMYYAVVLKDDAESGKQHTVLLAPAAYLKDRSLVPSEGDAITVNTIRAFDANGNNIYVARSIRTASGRTLQLRNSEGDPAWTGNADARSGGSYLALATEMDDGSLHAQGKEFGSVHDVVFEAHSGSAAFAVISAGGLLGIDDTLYPIPCGSFGVGTKNTLFMDMPVSKLKLAPKLSNAGVKDLNHSEFTTRVCEYFGVKPKKFDIDRSKRWTSDRGSSGH